MGICDYLIPDEKIRKLNPDLSERDLPFAKRKHFLRLFGLDLNGKLSSNCLVYEHSQTEKRELGPFRKEEIYNILVDNNVIKDNFLGKIKARFLSGGSFPLGPISDGPRYVFEAKKTIGEKEKIYLRYKEAEGHLFVGCMS